MTGSTNGCAGFPIIREFDPGGNAFRIRHEARSGAAACANSPCSWRTALPWAALRPASAVDIPFPNFTGPASASGLFFRQSGQEHPEAAAGPSMQPALEREYATPLAESTYGANARLSLPMAGLFWQDPACFSEGPLIWPAVPSIFFPRGSIVETGRFLRSHILSSKGLRELVADTSRGLNSLHLWDPLLKTLISPATPWRWTVQSLPQNSQPMSEPCIWCYMSTAGRVLA